MILKAFYPPQDLTFLVFSSFSLFLSCSRGGTHHLTQIPGPHLFIPSFSLPLIPPAPPSVPHSFIPSSTHPLICHPLAPGASHRFSSSSIPLVIHLLTCSPFSHLTQVPRVLQGGRCCPGADVGCSRSDAQLLQGPKARPRRGPCSSGLTSTPSLPQAGPQVQGGAAASVAVRSLPEGDRAALVLEAPWVSALTPLCGQPVLPLREACWPACTWCPVCWKPSSALQCRAPFSNPPWPLTRLGSHAWHRVGGEQDTVGTVDLRPKPGGCTRLLTGKWRNRIGEPMQYYSAVNK